MATFNLTYPHETTKSQRLYLFAEKLGNLGFSGTSERSGGGELTTEIRVPEVAPCQYYEGPVSGRSSMLPEPCITAHTCRIAYNIPVSKTGQTFSGRDLPDDRECFSYKLRIVILNVPEIFEFLV